MSSEIERVQVLVLRIIYPQGPKLTFLGRRQVATENFFSVAIRKNVVAKKQKKKCQ